MISARDLRLLAYFVQIARSGSIRKASEALSLTPPVVSEALSELEAIKGVTLISRTTRSMTLTDAGQALFESAARAISAADEAMSLGDEGPVEGTVSITLPIEFSVAWLPQRLRRFKDAYPSVRVDIHAADDVVPLSSSGYDMAIRATFELEPKRQESFCACEPLELVCAPHLVTSADEPLSKRLKRIGVIASSTTALDQREVLAINRRARRRFSNDSPCKVTVNSQTVAHRLALNGFGAALLLRSGVAEDIAAGKLVSIDDRYDYGYVTARLIERDPYPSSPARALKRILLER